MDFHDIWQLLLDNGASPRKEEGTRRFWDTLTPDQQRAAYTSIVSKLAIRAFVHYDPIRAIKENIWSSKPPQPQWKTGGETDEDLVQVKYGDRFKICTRATMELFGLQYVRDWN